MLITNIINLIVSVIAPKFGLTLNFSDSYSINTFSVSRLLQLQAWESANGA